MGYSHLIKTRPAGGFLLITGVVMLNKEKYIGLQSSLKKRSALLSCMGDYACLFLCMCSIADEFFSEIGSFDQVDIIEFAMKCRAKSLIDDEWTCLDQEKILKEATGVEWVKKEVKSLPKPVPTEMYTVEKWFNARTGFTHFKRRWGDTLENSVTVKEGKIIGYYTYTHS